MTRFALNHLWSPVGSTVMPASEVRFMVHYLFDDDDGRAMSDRIDRRVDRLPGLAGLNLMNSARENAAVRISATDRSHPCGS